MVPPGRGGHEIPPGLCGWVPLRAGLQCGAFRRHPCRHPVRFSLRPSSDRPPCLFRREWTGRRVSGRRQANGSISRVI